MAKGSLLKIGLWSRLIENFRLLCSLIKDYLKGGYRDVSPWSIFVFAFGVVYVLCPIDLLSDFIPFIGQIDDALILLVCIYFLEKDLNKYKEWKASRGE